MSRIGKNPIDIPDGVNIDLKDHSISVSGKKGSLDYVFHGSISLTQSDGQLIVSRQTDENLHKALHGTTRQLIQYMVIGVSKGFQKELQLVGVGYSADASKGNYLILNLGYFYV